MLAGVLVLALLVAAASGEVPPSLDPALACDFEDPCPWKWNSSRVVTGQEVNNSWVPAIVAGESHHSGGPFSDADNNTHGHFLYVLLKKTGPRRIHVWSPSFVRTGEPCRLTFSLHMHNMSEGSVKVIVNAVNHTQWIVYDNYGDDNNMWQNYSINIGKVKQKFSVILEFVPGRSFPLHIALDNIKLKNCFTEPPQNICGLSQFQCSANNACIELTKVCNIQRDCIDGEDEEQDCDKVPEFARCTFEEDWCGWHNVPGNHLNWTLNNGSTPTTFTGPNFDHTYQNETGMYVYVDMTGKSLHIGSAAQLESPVINPPPRYHANLSSPYYNSCFVSFYYHKYGPHSGSLGLFMIELQPKTNVTRKLWWSYGDKGNKWWRQIVILPNTAHKYILQFEARKSFASRGDPAIDDITISPKCFCIGVTPEHLNSCSFTIIEPTPPPVTHTNFVNSTYYMFSSCGASGRYGPKQENCSAAYNGTSVDVVVMKEKKTSGIQQWIVPESGYYTIIAKGASGGKGSDGVGMSWGAMVRTVIELRRGQKMYMLIGQEGNDACLKTFTSVQNVCRGKDDLRKKPAISKTTSSKIGEIAKLNYLPEGGGGGGGTYVFTWSKEGVKRPVVVAGGGGGLGLKASFSDTIQHGHGINRTLMPIAGEQQGAFPAGGGGGWDRGNSSQNEATGLSLLQGGVGGTACYISTDGSDKGAGGFGGGGAGCTAGGGGGGYTGGRAWEQKGMHGEGGYSWIDRGMMQRVWLSGDRGSGELYIIPAIEGCGCNYLCIALDSHRSLVQCICPQGWHVSNDSVSCLLNHSHKPPEDSFLAVVFYIIVGSVIITITVVFTFLYNRYQKKKDAFLRRKMLSGDPDVQLNRLRMASSNMMTEYNPNYEFGGGVYGLKDLKEIPREHLRLVKALGQGAFGEVYQGFFRSRPGDTVEMPVAVKTLPSLSTSQSETDFFMEALIMNKFNHPNIVHFIGVCFDTHPRYIVIELLAGGDLKTFLRESRPKPDRGSSLTMKDLLSCAIDVAKGCKYLEEHRFIHRDIAARNCLLTTKGPGRVVKIADFGMARDIYRNDYYRKGGKAMLPVKWMPPEAFLDGIFTTKTDVWSFGVVVWEVMSLGLVPYSAYTNPAVMKLVASGGRLEPPINCPSQLYAIMTQCWHPSPDDRPPFGLILERLGYCLQDPDVLSTPLPLYSIPPPSESEATVMRPTDQEECLQPDYLVPLTGGGGQGVGQQEWGESGVGANGGGPPQEEWESAGANHHGGLPESRSSQPLLLDANTASNNIPPTVNNNNTTDTKSSYHLNNMNHTDQGGVIMVPSYLKTNPEISC